jgi:hypothetical protein
VCCAPALLLLQVPRKLGLFASSQVFPNPFGIPFKLAATVTLVEAVSVLVKAADSDAPPQVRSAMLQQMTESGLLQCLDQLAEAIAVQLEQGSLGGDADETNSYQRAAANLLHIQVGSVCSDGCSSTLAGGLAEFCRTFECPVTALPHPCAPSSWL